MITIKRVLAPTDFSEHSQQAIKYACEISQRFEAELTLLHVVQPPTVALAYGTPLPEALLHPEPAAQEELNKLQLPDVGNVAQVQREIRSGTPFVEILRYAKENHVDLVVMGTHGGSGLIHALIGSVAEKVVRKAACPVLTVRPEGHQFVMP